MKRLLLLTITFVVLSGMVFAGTIFVMSPKGTDKWNQGTTHNITWAASDECVSTIYRVQIFKSFESSKNLVKEFMPNFGATSVRWTIPKDLPAGKYFLKVKNYRKTCSGARSFTITDPTKPLTGKQGQDFQVIKMWTVNRSGNVRIKVQYNGPKPFVKEVYFGIWFNGTLKKPVKKLLRFHDNNQYEIILCNYSHLNTNSADGKLKVKVDVTSQYTETREDNNVFEKQVHFAEISKIELKVTPGSGGNGVTLKNGQIKKFTFTAKVTFRGRGTTFCEYFKDYTRSRVKSGQLGFVLLSKNTTGPSSFYCKLGPEYGTKTKTFSWYKIESYDNRTKNGEKHKRTFVIKAKLPNFIRSNPAEWIIRYLK